jgi:hypothetical protein
VPLAVRLMGDHAPISAARFFSKPSEMINRNSDFATGLSKRFSVFTGDGLGEFVPPALERSGHRQQIVGPLHPREGPPGWKRVGSGFYRLSGHRPVRRDNLGDRFSISRIDHGDGFARLDPSTADVEFPGFHGTQSFGTDFQALRNISIPWSVRG